MESVLLVDTVLVHRMVSTALAPMLVYYNFQSPFFMIKLSVVLAESVVSKCS